MKIKYLLTHIAVNQIINLCKSAKSIQQVFILSKRDIEQCYPNQQCGAYGNWRKTQEEVDAMNGHKKKQLAKYIGENITQQQFETDLLIVFNALQKCWKLAF
ncbi:MAG: hypothetical protein LBG96_15045 [Tannerella sp.]|jgi:hypothetical protein|nr:hypothetical protein [Tannerella sp.]